METISLSALSPTIQAGRAGCTCSLRGPFLWQRSSGSGVYCTVSARPKFDSLCPAWGERSPRTPRRRRPAYSWSTGRKFTRGRQPDIVTQVRPPRAPAFRATAHESGNVGCHPCVACSSIRCLHGVMAAQRSATSPKASSAALARPYEKPDTRDGDGCVRLGGRTRTGAGPAAVAVVARAVARVQSPSPVGGKRRRQWTSRAIPHPVGRHFHLEHLWKRLV